MAGGGKKPATLIDSLSLSGFLPHFVAPSYVHTHVALLLLFLLLLFLRRRRLLRRLLRLLLLPLLLLPNLNTLPNVPDPVKPPYFSLFLARLSLTGMRVGRDAPPPPFTYADDLIAAATAEAPRLLEEEEEAFFFLFLVEEELL